MPLPKKIEWVTFDVYGTLIDWETGAYEAFAAEAERDGFTIERDQLIPLFISIQKEIQSGSQGLSPGGGGGTCGLPVRGSCPPPSRAGSRSRRPTPSSTGSPRSTASASSRTSTTSS